MSKKIVSLTLTIILIITSVMIVSAASLPTSLEKPLQPVARTENPSIIDVRWTNPASILTLIQELEDGEHEASMYYLIDWKKNDGNWNVAISPSDPKWDGNLHGQFSGNMPNLMWDEDGVSETFFVTWHLDPTKGPTDAFDLKNDTYYFKIRYVLESYHGAFAPMYSPYSEVAAIGKNATKATITKLDAPQNLKVEVKTDSSDKPYFKLDWEIPQSIIEANKQLPVYHFIDFKVDDGKWLSETTPWDGMPGAASNLLTSTDTLKPVELNLVDRVVIEENTYYFRVAFVAEPPTANAVLSAYSNIASTKVNAYSDASAWAKSELDEADQKGLIPDSLRGADMTKPITREEFAELAVKLYEKTTGTSVTAGNNPFTDTTNPEIIKAYQLGITTGITPTTFAPKELTNREQVATMLTRTIKKMVPDGDFSTAGAPTFTDQKNISTWALDSVLYMAKQGIIKGSEGKFMPKAVTTAEIAAGYATTTREQAIAMSLRTYNQLVK